MCSQVLVSVKLQWGRAYSARRTGMPFRVAFDSFDASMGPGLFSPEDEGREENSTQEAHASMGPGLFSPEDWRVR